MICLFIVLAVKNVFANIYIERGAGSAATVKGSGPSKSSGQCYLISPAHVYLSISFDGFEYIPYSISQDGFGQVWSHDLLTEIIEEEVTKNDIHTV